jgi:hypothetical protein
LERKRKNCSFMLQIIHFFLCQCHVMPAFLLLLLLSVPTFVQEASKTKLTGFFGMPFGSSMEECRKVMLSKGGTLDKKSSNASALVFDAVTFGGRKTFFMRLEFHKNRLCNAKAFFKPVMEAKVFDLYNDIKADLTSKYPDLPQEFETYKYPYEKGDGHEITAIKLGKASVATFWVFADNNAISIEIISDVVIKLTYEDAGLARKAIEEEKVKSSSDY